MPTQSITEGMVDYSAPGTRSLAEIEAEMRAQTQKARDVQKQDMVWRESAQLVQLEQSEAVLSTQ